MALFVVLVQVEYESLFVSNFLWPDLLYVEVSYWRPERFLFMYEYPKKLFFEIKII